MGVFRDEMGRAQAQHVPSRVIGSYNKPREPWIIREIQDTMSRKREVFNKHKESKSVEALVEHKSAGWSLRNQLGEQRGDMRKLWC